MATQEQNTELREKIEAQKNLFTKLIPPILELVDKLGKRTHYKQGNSHTNIEHTLDDFQGYTFVVEGGQTMMGGSSLKIKKKSSGKEYLRPVLDLQCGSLSFSLENFFEDGRVTDGRYFGEHAEILLRALEHRDEYLQKLEEAAAQAARDEEARKHLEKEYDELSAEAERFGITVGTKAG